MDFDIKRIEKNTPIKGVFFFDTMIWLSILAPEFSEDNSRMNKYIGFFDKVYNDPHSKIAVSSLSISELTNTYFRVVAVRMYEKENNTTVHHNEFKTKYRTTAHFKDQYQIICDEIDARSDSLIYVDHTLEQTDLVNAVNYPSLDFNDYCYYQICKNQGITIVTDDQDFFVEKLKVLTLNSRLMDRYYEELTKGLR
tara:strand:+ start:2124 stop:2711 length:588 start_codon:yes stop_codon:yes gene_type:complete